jgi:type IV pilus assembly protein PilV
MKPKTPKLHASVERHVDWSFHSGPRHQQGAGLLEVMIAVLIMGIGLLGIAAMQSTALRNSQSSLERSQAVIQAYSILDAMRANRAVAVSGGYDIAMTCAAPAAGTLANNDIRAWIQAMRTDKVLGAGTQTCGQISCPANSPCTITVQWDDSRASDSTALSASTAQTVSVTTLL